MLVVASVTLWLLFSAWLTFPLLGAPHAIRRGIVLLLWAELVSLLAWSYGSEDCLQRPCGAVAEAAHAAAGEDLPALSAVLLGLAVAHGVRSHRAR